MKVSVIVTVLNESRAITDFLDTLVAQTRPPDEVVVVDAGSTDETVPTVEAYSDRLPLRVLVEPGGRGHGRNVAVVAATHDVIACTDAGCRLEPTWLERITAPFESGPVAVASGGYLAEVTTRFEMAVATLFVDDMDTVDIERWLPSSRSIAFTKESWAAVGGYPEFTNTAEDTLFDLKLRAAGFQFADARDAIVRWRPRSNPRSFIASSYRYAYGDGAADLFRAHFIILSKNWAATMVATALLSARFRRMAWIPAAHRAWHLSRTVKAKRRSRQSDVPAAPLVVLQAAFEISQIAGYWHGSIARALRRVGPG